MVTPGTPPIPHVGGPILPPGAPTVLIGGTPAAVVGGMCTCVGPPDAIIPPGSPTVLIGGMPAARMGDMTAHGGSITLGFPTVMLAEPVRRARIAAVVAVGTALALAPASGSAQQVVAPRCVTTQLALLLTAYEAQMTGEHGSMFALRNRGGTTCSLLGYPRVRLLDGRGELLVSQRLRQGHVPAAPTAAARRPPARPQRLRPRRQVPLRPRRRALGEPDRAHPAGRPLGPDRPPPRAPAARDYEYCRGGPGNVLQISPVAASPQALAGG